MFKKSFNSLKVLLCVLCCALIILVAALWLCDDAVQPPDTSDRVVFFDVGQGDSALIASGEFAALIDTSTATKGMQISKKLRREGINEIDALILTHPHDDHTGSAEFLLGEFPVKNIILSDALARDDEDARCYRDIKEYAKQNNINLYFATEGMVINIGNFELTVLMCDTKAKDENDTSIVIMAENSGKRFLFMGDAEMAAETKLINDSIDVNCDVLKVGHHGGNTSSSEKFLKKATPLYSVISCGKDNMYSHPHEEVIKRLNDVNTNVLRTDKDGDIKFKIENEKISYIVE